jgi:hypothetical protein
MKKDLIRTIGGLFWCTSMDQSEHCIIHAMVGKGANTESSKMGFVFDSFFPLFSASLLEVFYEM